MGPIVYALRNGAEIVFASLAWVDLETACNDFKSILQMAPQKRHRIVHVTLSMPAGMRLDTADWRLVIGHALTGLGVDCTRHPLLATRHTDTTCDHVHIVFSRVTWLGDAVALDLTEMNSARIHTDLAIRLGLPEPDYALLTPASRLASRLPARRTEPSVRALHETVANALVKFRPGSIHALDQHLRPTGFRIVLRDVRGKPLPTFLGTDGRPFRRRDLKPDLTSNEILARLAHAKALTATALVIQAYLLIRTLNRNTLNHLKGLINARNADNFETPSCRRNPVDPHRKRDVGSEVTTPPSRPPSGNEPRLELWRSPRFVRSPALNLHNDRSDDGKSTGNRYPPPGHRTRSPNDQRGTTDPDRLTYATWLRQLLMTIKAARKPIDLKIARIGVARLTFADGTCATLNGRQLQIDTSKDQSRDVENFLSAFPAGFITKFMERSRNTYDRITQDGSSPENLDESEKNPKNTDNEDSFSLE